MLFGRKEESSGNRGGGYQVNLMYTNVENSRG